MLVGSAHPKRLLEMVPAPMWTDTWHPVSHASILDAVEIGLRENQIAVRDRHLALAGKPMIPGLPGNARMFGIYHLDLQVDGQLMSLGFRNSVDKSMAIAFCAGSYTFVCDNLAFSGNFVEFRKHTSGLDYDELNMRVSRAIAAAEGNLLEYGQWIKSLDNYELESREQFKTLVYELIHAKGMACSKYWAFHSAFKEEQKRRGFSFGAFFQAATAQVRDLSPFTIQGRCIHLNNLIKPWVPVISSDPSRGTLVEQIVV